MCQRHSCGQGRGGLLSAASLAAMTSPQVSADAPPVAGVDAPAQGARASAHYGYGVRIDAIEGGPSVIGHGGAVAGYVRYATMIGAGLCCLSVAPLRIVCSVLQNAWCGYEPLSGFGLVIFRSYSPGTTQLGAVATELLREIAAAQPA